MHLSNSRNFRLSWDETIDLYLQMLLALAGKNDYLKHRSHLSFLDLSEMDLETQHSSHIVTVSFGQFLSLSL